MNSILCTCPQCQFPLRLPDESLLGHNAKCPQCKSYFTLKASGSQGTQPTDDTATLVANGEQKTDRPPNNRPAKPLETRSEKPNFSQVIDRRYELIQKLGSGGFGVVWKARDIKLDRVVAIKLPRQELIDDDTAKQIQREAQTAAKLKHPNIVAVYEVKNDADSLYIVSEYVEGITLTEWKEGQTISSRQSAELTRKLATTIHHAHEAGIVHRDMKPGNVLIDRAGELHITDFGLAKRDDIESSMSEAGRTMGTPAYMSPEQARGESRLADRRTDLYSLGVMLFELVTGERPFRGTKWGALQYQILTQEPPKPRALNPDVPTDLETICLKCLEKDPNKRYATAMELAEELARFLNNEPILARPIGRISRFWRACKRQPLIASLSAVLVLVLVSGSFVSGYFGIEANKRAKEADEAKNNAITESEKAKTNEARASKAENDLREETNSLRIQQARQSVAEGDRNWYENRTWPEYLLWYARALELSPEGSEEQRINRMRLASALTDNPLEDFWPGVRFAAFSPDGKRIATTADNGDIVIYDTQSHKKLTTLRASNLPMVHTAFNSDGSQVVGVGHHKRATVWNVETGVRVFETPELQEFPVWTTFNPQGDMLFVLTQDQQKVRHLERFKISNREREPALDAKFNILDVSPDAKKALASIDDNTAVLIDSLSGTQIGSEMKHDLALKGGRFNANGRSVITYSGSKSFDLAPAPPADAAPPAPPNEPAVQTESKSAFQFVAFQEADPGTNQVRVWDASSGEATSEALSCSFFVNSVALSPDGQLLAAGGESPPPLGIERRNEAVSGTFAVSHNLQEPPQAAPVIVQQSLPTEGRMMLWNLDDPAVKQREMYVNGIIHTLDFTPKGNNLISGGSRRYASLGQDEVTCWSVDPDQFVQGQYMWPVEFSPRMISFGAGSDRVLVSGTAFNRGGARLWNLDHSNNRGMLENSLDTTIAVFSSEGKTIQGTGGSFGYVGPILTWDADLRTVLSQSDGGKTEERTRRNYRTVFETRAEKFTVFEADGPVELVRQITVPAQVQTEEVFLSRPAFRQAEEDWYRESQITLDIRGVQLPGGYNTEILGISPDQSLLILFEAVNDGLGFQGARSGNLRLVDAKTGRPRSRVMPSFGGAFLARMDPSQRILVVASGDFRGTPEPATEPAPAPVAVEDFQVAHQTQFTATTVEVWDVQTGTLVATTTIPKSNLERFIQFDKAGERFLVKLTTGMHLFDLLPDWMPSDENMLVLAKWAAYRDIDEAGSVGDVNAPAVSGKWNELVR